jgi:hypothetical protein
LLGSNKRAAHGESGYLACSTWYVVWITERTGPGTITVAFGGVVGRQTKAAWSTTRVRTGLQATAWSVTATGELDAATTGAHCAR